jgi:DNA-binding transcriptional MerR regulator/DNA-directed RNA polymerase subunit RPC12/RpoP
MSLYTTGEIAKKTGITVRTVQYYDRKKLVSPTKLSEGGRRLYSDDDLKKLNLILFLKSLGLSLSTIKEILESPSFEKILKTLLSQRHEQLIKEINTQNQQLKTIEQINDYLDSGLSITNNIFDDIENTMNKKKKLFWLRTRLISLGLIIDVIEIALLWYTFSTHQILPTVLGFLIIFLVVGWLTANYYHQVLYICPHCQTKFRPSQSSFLFAKHSPKTRKLTCPNCKKFDFCVEVFK